jgi:hypothetical protein
LEAYKSRVRVRYRAINRSADWQRGDDRSVADRRDPSLRLSETLSEMKEAASLRRPRPSLRKRFLRVSLQPERFQALHIFDRGLMPGMLLVEGVINFSLLPFALVECRFGHFAIFCAHHVLLFSET